MDLVKTLDLFAGIGGIRKGFEKTGKFETVFANDLESNCKATYDLNFDTCRLTVGDLRNLSVKEGDIPAFDFLLGGFPCQPFSVAGLRQAFDDHKGRGNLIHDIVRILKEAEVTHGKPKGFMLENVKNLIDIEKGAVYETIKELLEEVGYFVDCRVYNSLNFGVPQSRQRVYIIGFSDKKDFDNFEWPEKAEKTSLRVKDVLDTYVEPHHYYNDKPLYEKIKDAVTNNDSVYLYRRNHVREHETGYSPTLVASMGQGGHNVPIIKDMKGIRRLTPMECAKLQGYHDLKIPHEVSEIQIYKQIGNSVAVPVVYAIANRISEVLSSKVTTPLSRTLEMSNIP